MNKSESVKELAAALCKAQGALKGAVKDTANPFFKSKYADLASVWDAVREPFSANGLSIVQVTLPSEGNEIVLETTLMHSSGEWVSGVLSLPVSKADAQGYGSAMTYARRYGLAAITGVAPEDDDGNAAAKAAPKTDAAKSAALSMRHTPTGGTWESQSVDMQIYLTEIAQAVSDWLAAGKAVEALEEIRHANLDADQKTALWTRFDSKQRSAMKRAEAEEKERIQKEVAA